MGVVAMPLVAATALGFPGDDGEDSLDQFAKAQGKSPLPPRGDDESTTDRIARLQREIVRSSAPV